jgi:hypothetical protein
VDQWVDELTDLAVGHGFDTFVFWGEGSGQLPRFADEVVPAVRAHVAAERGWLGDRGGGKPEVTWPRCWAEMLQGVEDGAALECSESLKATDSEGVRI